jgi:outer membrane immunogenic protein
MRIAIAACALLAAANLAWSAERTPALAPAPQASPPALAPSPELPYSWAGFYIDSSGDLGLGTGAAGATASYSLLSGATSAGPVRSVGGFSGGSVGANWQAGDTVVGWQGDMQWADQSAGAITDCGLGCSLNEGVRVPWLATFRARAGKAFDRLYVYGTGGVASSGSSANLNAGGVGSTPDFINLSPNSLDWTIGGGMEFALDSNVTAKIEYLHNTPTSAADSLFDSSVGDSMKNNVVRGGIDYRLPVSGW